MENKVLRFNEWESIIESKKEESKKEEEKEEKNPLIDKIGDLSVNINDTVTFDKSKKLEIEDKVWHILGVIPDKAHRKLKVIYKEGDSEKEKKSDFFDFHKDVQEPLYNLLKKNL